MGATALLALRARPMPLQGQRPERELRAAACILQQSTPPPPPPLRPPRAPCWQAVEMAAEAAKMESVMGASPDDVELQLVVQIKQAAAQLSTAAQQVAAAAQANTT